MKIGYIERRVIKEKEGGETKKVFFFFSLSFDTEQKRNRGEMDCQKRKRGMKMKTKIKTKIKIKIRAAFELFIFGSYFLLLFIISSR